MRSFRSDYAFGMVGETDVLPRINKHFSTSFCKGGTYDPFDFHSDSYDLELKRRTNKHNTYPDTMIPYSKIKHIKKKTVFCFLFTDGLYYIQYEPEVFSSFDKKMFVRSARSDKIDVPQEYIYIPVKCLNKIE